MLEGPILLIFLALAIAFIVISSARYRLHPFLGLVIAGVGFGLSAGMRLGDVIAVVTGGFGSLMTGIGLIIVLGTIIGVFVEKTGAAEVMAKVVLGKNGSKRLIPGVSSVGALVGIPVFCDSGFVILSQLNKKLAALGGTGRVGLNIALAGGLYATHVLVPPTPGPLAAAGNLGMENELGMVILVGFLCMIPAVFVSGWWASRFRDVEAVEDIGAPVDLTIIDSEDKTRRKLPGFWISILPIALPIGLIALASVLRLTTSEESGWVRLLMDLGNPNAALILGVACAFGLRKFGRKGRSMEWIEEALRQAGPILMITCAGGAFGAVIAKTPVVDLFETIAGDGKISGIWLYPLMFLLTAGLKTSQGSSTAAMVVVSSLAATLLPAWGLTGGFDTALLVAAIGGGAMTVSHANDSYFWVVTNFGGMDMRQTYRTFTTATLLQGITVLVTVMALKLLSQGFS